MMYSSGFRNSVLKKVLPPSTMSISSISKETGVSGQRQLFFPINDN